MTTARSVATETALTPEVSPISSLILHPLLSDPKFVLAVLAVLLSVVVFSFTRSSSKRKVGRGGTPQVLLVGSPDSGKTSLFSKIAHGARTETHTSSVTSSTTFILPLESGAGGKQITLVDLPGHARLRDEVKRNVKTASAVVFAVDVAALLRTAGAIAEELPPMLTTLCTSAFATDQPAKLLILATKTDTLLRPASPNPCPDIPVATRQIAIDRLTSILTREMDRLKQSRASTGGRIEGIGRVQSSSTGLWTRLFGSGRSVPDEGTEIEEDESLVWGGKGAFRWEDVEGVEVEWAVSALGPVKATGEDGQGLAEVKEWLSKV